MPERERPRIHTKMMVDSKGRFGHSGVVITTGDSDQLEASLITQGWPPEAVEMVLKCNTVYVSQGGRTLSGSSLPATVHSVDIQGNSGNPFPYFISAGNVRDFPLRRPESETMLNSFGTHLRSDQMLVSDARCNPGHYTIDELTALQEKMLAHYPQASPLDLLRIIPC